MCCRRNPVPRKCSRTCLAVACACLLDEGRLTPACCPTRLTPSEVWSLQGEQELGCRQNEVLFRTWSASSRLFSLHLTPHYLDRSCWALGGFGRTGSLTWRNLVRVPSLLPGNPPLGTPWRDQTSEDVRCRYLYKRSTSIIIMRINVSKRPAQRGRHLSSKWGPCDRYTQVIAIEKHIICVFSSQKSRRELH